MKIIDLKWSEILPPDNKCNYHHVFVETPIGRIEITWKGWKKHPSYDVELLDEYYFGENTLDDAKKQANEKFIELVKLCLVE